MKDLFYSEKDNTLFWVAGYTTDNNTSNVAEMIKSLAENGDKFANHCDCKAVDVKTLYVEESRKYKYMRVFYIEKPLTIPDDAYKLNGDYWTMEKWITN